MNHEQQNQEPTHGHAGHHWHMLLCLAMVGAVFFLAPRGTETAPAQAPIPQQAQDLRTAGAAREFTEQQAEAGGVTVVVQPKRTLDGMAFELVFDTHSVELDFDPKLALALADAGGKELPPRGWTGDPAGGPARTTVQSGGHHRTIIVSFDALPEPPFTFLVRNVGGVPERIFKWEKSL